jgi:2-dehydropantoate 2-reductase
MIDIDDSHVDAINGNGLRMSGLRGDFTAAVSATTDPSSVSDVDVALICVNGYATDAAAQTARSILSSSGFVISLQNGVGNLEKLTAVVREGRVLGGLTFHSADMKALGHVEHTNEGPTFIGELNGDRSQRLRQLEHDLETADLNPVVEPNIMLTIWSKFVHNCGINAICAITDLRPGHINEVPDLDEFQELIIQEALELLQAKGISLDDPDPVKTIKDYCASKFHRVSMAQHIANGVRTEIDSLNGYVSRESVKYGLRAPMNDALTRLIKGREHQAPSEES